MMTPTLLGLALLWFGAFLCLFAVMRAEADADRERRRARARPARAGDGPRAGERLRIRA